MPVLSEGKAEFAIVTTIDRQFFQQRIDAVALPPGWFMVLKDARGDTIAGRPQNPIKDPATRLVANSQVSRWTVTVEIPYGAHWRPLVSAAAVLGSILLGATSAGFLGGKWAGHRFGRSVASLAQPAASGTLPPDILEVAAARRLLDEAAQRRTAAENTLAWEARSSRRKRTRSPGRMEPFNGCTLDLAPVSLPVNTAVPCGLILNEWVNNALKHAFPGRADGEVTVSLEGGAHGRVRLGISDNGIGLPAGFDWRQARSLGLRLVKMLAGQLHAALEVTGGKGTRFTIIIERPDP